MISEIILSAFLTIFCVTGQIYADPLQSQEKHKISGQTSISPARFESVRTKILETIEKTGIASVAVAVAKDGEILWEEGFGWADRESQIQATPQTMYHMASISKSMTATGLMLLVERGLVDLDRPANDYLGDAKLTAFVGSTKDATIKRIMVHTAGLPMYWNLIQTNDSRERPTMEESIRRYGILVSAPGERYNYSNFGYGIIDHIISRVSGRDYPDFMRKEIFAPLGMTHSSVLVDSNLKQHVAKMYNARQQLIAPFDFDHRGASAVISSVHDLVRFGMFHLLNHLPDQKPILSDESVRKLHSEAGAQFPNSEGGTVVDYLLGSFGGVDFGGYRFEVTTGSMPVGGVVSRLDMVPSENIVSAIVANGSVDLWDIEKHIFSIMLPDFAEREVGEQTEEEVVESIPPELFRGAWSGQVYTYSGEVPVKMNFSENGIIEMEIQGKPANHLAIETPLGKLGFKGNQFKGLFMGRLDTPDAARAPHVVYVECQMRDGRLTGFAAAIAMNQSFCLPYGLELFRIDQKKE